MLRNLNRSYSGSRICGTPHSGVRGDLLPSTGTDGPSLLYNDASLPSENADEFRLYVTSWPAGLDLFVFEDGSFTASGPDGVYTGTYDGEKNGISYGSASFSITIGASGIDGVLASTLASATLSAAGTLAIVGILGATLDDATLSAAGAVALSGALTATLDDAALSATGALSLAGALGATLDDATLSADGASVSGAGLDVTLDDAALVAVGALALSGLLDVTLADTTLSAAGALVILGSASLTLDDCTIVAAGSQPAAVGSAAAVWEYLVDGSRTAAEILLDTNLMMREVWREHGLDIAAPLVVANNSRVAGSQTQTITESGGVVTVQRT